MQDYSYILPVARYTLKTINDFVATKLIFGYVLAKQLIYRSVSYKFVLSLKSYCEVRT